jgi:hypothetical protein
MSPNFFSIYSIAMGIVMLGAGILCLVYAQKMLDDKTKALIFGGAVSLYGAFRIWRGYVMLKKTKKSNEEA